MPVQLTYEFRLNDVHELASVERALRLGIEGLKAMRPVVGLWFCLWAVLVKDSGPGLLSDQLRKMELWKFRYRLLGIKEVC